MPLALFIVIVLVLISLVKLANWFGDKEKREQLEEAKEWVTKMELAKQKGKILSQIDVELYHEYLERIEKIEKALKIKKEPEIEEMPKTETKDEIKETQTKKEGENNEVQ